MYLINFWPLACKPVPKDHCSLIVTACQKVLVVATPADTAEEGGEGERWWKWWISINYVLTNAPQVSLYELTIVSPYFGVACHFVDRIMNVHSILDHRSILKNFNFLGDTSNGEIITVTVKLNAVKTMLQVWRCYKS